MEKGEETEGGASSSSSRRKESRGGGVFQKISSVFKTRKSLENEKSSKNGNGFEQRRCKSEDSIPSATDDAIGGQLLRQKPYSSSASGVAQNHHNSGVCSDTDEGVQSLTGSPFAHRSRNSLTSANEEGYHSKHSNDSLDTAAASSGGVLQPLDNATAHFKANIRNRRKRDMSNKFRESLLLTKVEEESGYLSSQTYTPAAHVVNQGVSWSKARHQQSEENQPPAAIPSAVFLPSYESSSQQPPVSPVQNTISSSSLLDIDGTSSSSLQPSSVMTRSSKPQTSPSNRHSCFVPLPIMPTASELQSTKLNKVNKTTVESSKPLTIHTSSASTATSSSGAKKTPPQVKPKSLRSPPLAMIPPQAEASEQPEWVRLAKRMQKEPDEESRDEPPELIQRRETKSVVVDFKPV